MTSGLTVVIPAYNSAAIVADAIASARAQTLQPHEIIVVDDGSADDSAGVAERAGAKVIRQANGGPGAARNTGIRAATTDWIALLDADDIAYPERLATEWPFTADPDVAVVCSRHYVPGYETPTPPPTLDFDTLWVRNWVPTSTVLLRKSAWEAVGGFDEARELIGVEDYNFWLRLTHAGWRIHSLLEMLVEYRPTAASLTAQLERFAAAELLNAGRISDQLNLDPARRRAREFSIYREYGIEFFHYRKLPLARHYLREAARRGRLGRAGWIRLVASWLPLPQQRAS